ncbi:Lipoprotein OS=Streptomyces alboniger OX=132473 GN=CP975_27820 PE=4 SV=1 [Streptomyces alboniger]
MKGDARQSGGQTMAVDLAVDRKKNCDGTIRMQNARADVRQVDQTFYMRGDEAYWKTAFKGQPGADKAIPKLKDKWAKMPAGDDASEGMCDKQQLIASLDENKSERKGMKKSGTTTVGGQEAIKLIKKKSDGETLALYVATEGEPYILRSSSEGGKTPNTATYSDYGKAVSPEKPAADETVDLEQLAGAE